MPKKGTPARAAASTSHDSPDQPSVDNAPSPPRTPPPQMSRTANSRGAVVAARSSKSRPSVRDAFTVEQARDGDNEPAAGRDSHDLHWTPGRQRRSVLENMLASLDQAASIDSLGQPPTSSGSTEPFRYTIATSSRDRAHPFTSLEHSSVPESPTKATHHRSNSNHIYQSVANPFDTNPRRDGANEDALQDDDHDALNATPKASRHNKGFARGDRGNSSGSVDLSHPYGDHWQTNPKRRSRSFDQGFTRPPFQFEATTDHATGTAAFHSFEAAPMPTVNARPRQKGQPEPLPISPAQNASELEAAKGPSGHRGSLRSPAGYLSAPERSSSPKRGEPQTERPERPTNLRHGASYDDATRQSKSIDMPTYSMVTSVSGPALTPSRPGFFRRVFTSSKSPTVPDHSQSSSSRHASESAPSGVGRNDSSLTPSPFSKSSQQQTLPSSAKDTKKAKGNEKERERPPLQKKSSFFRRRKKSVSQPGVPDLPPQLQPEMPTRRPPTNDGTGRAVTPSSLRQAMDTYMTSPAVDGGGNRGSVDASRERMHNGHPTIRAVQQTEQRTPDIWDSSQYHETARRKAMGTEAPGRASQPSDKQHKETDSARRGSASREVPSQSSQPRRMKSDEPSSDTDGRDTMEQNILQSFVKASTTQQGNDDADYETLTGAQTSSTTIKSPKSLKLPRTDGRKPSVDISVTTTMTTTTTQVRHGEERNGSMASPGSKPAAEKEVEQIWVIPDASSAPPTKPPPPPPTSPSAEKLATAPFGDQIQSVPTSETSEDEEPERKTAPSPCEIARFVAQQGAETPSAAGEDDGPASEPSEPSEEERELAWKLFHGSDGFDRGDAAAWLGEEGPDRARVLKAYMQIFNWNNMSILQALRRFCAHTRLKGETQQVDRVLVGVSARWCECNPKHGFKATEVVHTICYSILLLNTDLHTADVESKMSRGQFIRNTLPTIQRAVEDAVPDAFKQNQLMMPPPPRPRGRNESRSPSTGRGGERRPNVTRRATDRSDSDAVISTPGTPVEASSGADECGPLVNGPFTGKQAAWELQIEIVLKNFYNSIRQERLYLYGTDQVRPSARAQPSSNSLSAMGGAVRRSNSIASRTGSESLVARGRPNEGRPGFSSRWSSKTRSRPKLYPASSVFARSRTSIDDDGTSAVSPSASSLWSRMSFGKTANSMSVTSFPPLPTPDYQQSIGFANALSQAMIREEATGDGEESLRVRPLLEDESLELTGAPWAKEGIVQHKHHLEALDKKARDRSWVECFAVIEKGWMRLFQFNVTARSLRQKSRSKSVGGGGGVVGGGNWSENAEPMGSFLLRQSIATALPPPGYSKTRQHVWALSLPNGAVHLFHVGTPDIVKEFVSTANYWSARMSKEPLIGGVSNIEYGWSDAVVNTALVQDRESRPSTTGSVSAPRPSMQGSVRTSMDRAGVQAKLPADRVAIIDWTPPMQSTMPSQLMEVDQLRALAAYVANVEKELKRHNELRGPMQLAFSPRHPNYVKAMNNWERKSSYLLQEIVKFSTYIESLRAAQAHKERIYAERNEREAELSRTVGLQELPADTEAETKKVASTQESCD